MEWIQRDYPELLGVYESILMKKDISYFEEILKTYGTDARVKTFPYESKSIAAVWAGLHTCGTVT